MIRKLYRCLGVSVLLFFWCTLIHAQNRAVTGTVTDATGSAVPGVNVLIKGTTTGTATDGNGAFTLQAADGDILVVSFIGYQTQEVPVGVQTNIAITLEDDLTTLSEVIVVGYGVQKKVLNTGANLQVEGESLQRLSTTNALQALQGQAAGVQITSTSGQPGESMKVVIRGLGTNNNASPLYVVDGVLTGDISYLSNADIESMTVLKDAASAAIYGSQAANGVVLITTRTGKKGANAKITFDSYYGVQNVARKTEMLNSRQFASIVNESAVNSGKLPVFTNDEIAAMGKGTDWIDEMFVKNAVTQSYTLGASGGSETSVYSTSISYLGQEGIVGGRGLSNYERYNFKINSEHKLYNDKITIGQHLTMAHVDNNGIGVGNQYNNSLRGAFNTSPFVPMYDADGNFFDNSDGWNSGEANPYAVMVYSNQNRKNNQKLVGDVYFQFELLKNLKFRTSLGLDYYSNERHSFTPVYTLSAYAFNPYSKVSQGMGKGRTWLFDNLLTYSFDLPNDHHFDAMVGTSAYQYQGSSIWGDNGYLVFNSLKYGWLSNATNQDGSLISLGGKPENEDKRMSYFGRLNYNWKETYMLNATFRVDGSSRFADHWGYFPSVSAGWVMSNEQFMSSTSDWLNSFKLRASWGQVGNLNVDQFQYLALVQFANTNYVFGPKEGSDGLVPGAYPKRLANPDVKWETSEQTDIGFDARLLNGALTVNFDWYKKVTKDWLVVAPILATAGADAPFINGGNVENSGIELVLAYNGKIGDLGYNIGVNGAYNKNKVTRIPTADGIIHGANGQLFDNSREFYRAETGFPIGYFWGLKTDGIFQTEEEVDSYVSGEGKKIQPNAMPGDVRFVDRNDDGVINDNDRTNIGNPNPDFTFGFTLGANYKGFDFSLLANGVAGNQLVQSYRNQANPYANYTTAILDRWHGPGSSNSMPRVTEDNRNWTTFSDLYVQDGDFLRISNVTLGYDFTKLISSKYVSQVRLFASVLNLYTFTKYTGMDPEVGFGIDNGSTDRFSSGIDLGYYPRPRTMMVGLNVKF